jgi:hypothetical protein
MPTDVLPALLRIIIQLLQILIRILLGMQDMPMDAS